MIDLNNLLAQIPDRLPAELTEILLTNPAFQLERLISTGHSTAAGQWYDQETHEWVLLLTGGAGLRFEGEEEVRILKPGDFLNIPAHCRHRVEWTDPGQPTVWLALHYRP